LAEQTGRDLLSWFDSASDEPEVPIEVAAEAAAVKAEPLPLPEPTLDCLVPAHLRDAVIALQADQLRARTHVPAHAPSLAEWATHADKALWACQWCRGPALAGSYRVGHACSVSCAMALKGF